MVSILIAILIFGLILYLINSFIPMDARIKSLFNIVAVIILIIYLFRALNLNI